MRRPTALLTSFVALLVALLALAPGAPAKPKPRLEIYKLEANTDANHETKLRSGATVRSCESDPLYAITFFYRWSGMKQPGRESLLLTGPGGFKEGGATRSLFESHGNNADLATAEQFKTASKALPAGHYRFKATLDAITRTASVNVVSAKC
jgi:hypothetical protein